LPNHGWEKQSLKGGKRDTFLSQASKQNLTPGLNTRASTEMGYFTSDNKDCTFVDGSHHSSFTIVGPQTHLTELSEKSEIVAGLIMGAG
jgi:hypothetical protein